jgi:biotin carboxyl carrier protein
MSDVRAWEAGRYCVIDRGRVIRVTQAGEEFLVNGKRLAMATDDPRDRKRSAAGGHGAGKRDVKAAMPGKVIRVLVEPGETVTAGQGLLILEAMKMQNELRSPAAGRVAAVRVQCNDAVAAGQSLVTLE